MNQKRTIPFTFLSAALLLAGGCASAEKTSGPRRDATRDATRTVAQLIAKTGAAGFVFKDTEITQYLTSCLSETQNLKFGILLDRDLATVSQYYGDPLRPADAAKLVSSITTQIKEGKNNFDFKQGSWTVSVAPIKVANDVVGYAAVAAL